MNYYKVVKNKEKLEDGVKYYVAPCGILPDEIVFKNNRDMIRCLFIFDKNTDPMSQEESYIPRESSSILLKEINLYDYEGYITDDNSTVVDFQNNVITIIH